MSDGSAARMGGGTVICTARPHRGHLSIYDVRPITDHFNEIGAPLEWMGHSERSLLVSNPVQGWYADPAGTDQLRWWDGTQWTDRYQALPGADDTLNSDTSTTPDPGADSSTEPSQTPAGATTEFTPVTQAPASRATRGQVITAVVATIVALAFLGSTIVAAGMHGKAQDDVHRSQTILNEAKEQLQKVQEAIQ